MIHHNERENVRLVWNMNASEVACQIANHDAQKDESSVIFN